MMGRVMYGTKPQQAGTYIVVKALRDITDQDGFPTNITLPTKP